MEGNPLLSRLLQEINSVRTSIESHSHEVSGLSQSVSSIEKDLAWIKENASSASRQIDSLKQITTELKTTVDLTLKSGRGSPAHGKAIEQINIELTKSVTGLRHSIDSNADAIKDLRSRFEKRVKDDKEEARWEWSRWTGIVGIVLAVLAIVVPLLLSSGKASSDKGKTNKEGR
jgi:phage shock protein A